VWRENPTDDDGQGIGVFVSLGLADEEVSACTHGFAIGAEWTGLLASRDYDVLAFGILFADLSNADGAGTPDDETAFELLYKAQLTPAISLKPELQYIVNPGGIAGADDVLVGLLRLEILF
jgi:porin